MLISSGCLHCYCYDYIKTDICFCISLSMYPDQILRNSNRLYVWRVWQSICYFSPPSLTQLKYPRPFVDLRNIKAGSYKSRFPIRQSEEFSFEEENTCSLKAFYVTKTGTLRTIQNIDVLLSNLQNASLFFKHRQCLRCSTIHCVSLDVWPGTSAEKYCFVWEKEIRHFSVRDGIIQLVLSVLSNSVSQPSSQAIWEVWFSEHIRKHNRTICLGSPSGFETASFLRAFVSEV